MEHGKGDGRIRAASPTAGRRKHPSTANRAWRLRTAQCAQARESTKGSRLAHRLAPLIQVWREPELTFQPLEVARNLLAVGKQMSVEAERKIMGATVIVDSFGGSSSLRGNKQNTQI
jgi:hypothetical protein